MKPALALTLALLAATAGGAAAAGLDVGLGAFGGTSFPIAQEDVSRGSLYGLRAPARLGPLFTVEPYFASGSLGDRDETIAGVTYTREGFDETALGVNVLLTTGGPVQFYPYAGLGSTRLERSGTDATLTTWSFGFGLGVSPLPKLSVHLRGELQMAVDAGASRKFGNVTLGASYALIHLP